ncbi:hypothetical protein IE81DRAFT_346807 [Ceraceosorus guamensis]|uniref:Uncharacterized protein n=1 Tax=Ceraceosorus guamensis TaxID=1522189 RepID=A0A316W0F3_9BASI|nr:hypothetical protein IE81DRAFT_346807 [Ceraceosorus guamensis]PWN43212.1 hypothetical protein IE81DRAFT_346807 [Ceraceosorus guamensis]
MARNKRRNRPANEHDLAEIQREFDRAAPSEMEIDEEFKAVREAMPEPLTDQQERMAEKNFRKAISGLQKAGASFVQQRRMVKIFEREKKVQKQEEAVAKREEEVKAREEKADARDAAFTKSRLQAIAGADTPSAVAAAMSGMQV